MELLVEYTNTYEKDFEHFTKVDQERIESKIEELCQSFLENPLNIYGHASRPHNINFYLISDSSLKSISVGQKIRVIATIDQDPIFDQVILTLIRVVKASHLTQAFKSIAESLYQDEFRFLGKDEQDDAKN